MSDQDNTQICFHEAKNKNAHKETRIKSEPPRTQSTAALQVLVGLVSGLVCDRKLDDNEIHYLDDWLKENITMNDVYPVNIYIRNIKAILKDKSVSNEEREQFLRFLEKQARFADRLYVPCEHIEALIQALRLAQSGKLQESLAAVSDRAMNNDSATCWVRATLHKMLGDEENSHYQYRYASVKYEDYANAEDELRAIIERLGIDLSVTVKPVELASSIIT
jgi:hypothetical protein